MSESHRSWQPVTERLAPTRRVIAMDLRGPDQPVALGVWGLLLEQSEEEVAATVDAALAAMRRPLPGPRRHDARAQPARGAAAVPGLSSRLTGLRNPRNLSFETLAGSPALVASDIGYDSAEEGNVIVAGGNYGWDAFEGTEIENATPVVGPERLRNPVVFYDRTLPSNQIDGPAVRVDGATAIVGGAIYRGVRAPRFGGQYVFGDIPCGRFFHVGEAALAAAHASGNPAPVEELLVQVDGTEVLFAPLIGSTSGRGDARFGRDQAGELYVLNKTDRIIRRLAIGPPLPPPTPTPRPTATPAPGDPATPDPTPAPEPPARPRPDQPIVVPPGEADVPLPARCRNMGPLNPIVGTSGADDLVGTSGSDLILGLGGDDCIVGGTGRDRVVGGAGDDRLFGARGNDVLRGGSGDDRLVGGPGSDRCRGGVGSDTLRSCEGPAARR